MNTNNKMSFKVNAVRTLTSPSNKKVTTYFTWVNFQDLPESFSLEVNPRKPKMNTAVAKQLINAVKSSDNAEFDINNRGIVITAKDFKFDNSKHQVTLDFGEDETQYGILDGGHTYTAIIQNRHLLPDDINKYVRLEILVGETLDVSALADARNTSLQVSDIALFELDDKFGFIKNVIQKESYGENIAYKDNENKPVQISELLKLMFAYNIKRYPDDSSAPVSAYSGKAAVFRDFKKEYDEEVKNNDPQSNIYRKLAPILPKLVELYEVIQKDLPEKYKAYKHEEGKNSKFGAVRGIESNGKFSTLFSKQPIDYEISVGFLLPIFGSFRALLKEDKNNSLYWHFDPLEVWERGGVRLVQNTFDTDTNPQQVGKSKTLWQANYRIVDSIRKDMLIEQFEEKK